MLGNSHCNLPDKGPSGCIRPWRCAFIARHRGQQIVWPSTMNEPPLSGRSWRRSAFVSGASVCCCDCMSGVRHFFNKSVSCLTIADDRFPKRTPIRHFDTSRAHDSLFRQDTKERKRVSHERCIVFRSGDYMLRYE